MFQQRVSCRAPPKGRGGISRPHASHLKTAAPGPPLNFYYFIHKPRSCIFPILFSHRPKSAISRPARRPSCPRVDRRFHDPHAAADESSRKNPDRRAKSRRQGSVQRQGHRAAGAAVHPRVVDAAPAARKRQGDGRKAVALDFQGEALPRNAPQADMMPAHRQGQSSDVGSKARWMSPCCRHLTFPAPRCPRAASCFRPRRPSLSRCPPG